MEASVSLVCIHCFGYNTTVSLQNTKLIDIRSICGETIGLLVLEKKHIIIFKCSYLFSHDNFVTSVFNLAGCLGD